MRLVDIRKDRISLSIFSSLHPCQDAVHNIQEQPGFGGDVASARIDHHLGRNAATVQGMVELVSLPNRYPLIVLSVQEQCRCGHPIGVHDG